MPLVKPSEEFCGRGGDKMTWIAFAMGFVFGAVFGLLVGGLCIASKDVDIDDTLLRDRRQKCSL